MNIRQAMALEAIQNYTAGLVLLVGTHVFKGRAKVNLERTLHSGIEIENVRQVDGSRLILPFEDEQGQPRRASLINEATNYGADIPGSKVSWRTLALDFESDTAISIIRRIARQKRFDARVTNLAESLQDKFGLSYEHLQSIDPRTVAVNCSYDGTARLGLHHTAVARAGYTYQRAQDGIPNLGGPSVIDHWAACRADLYVSTGIRIAEKTGIGLRYDVTLLGIAVEGQGYMGTTAWTPRFKEMMGHSGVARQPHDRHWFVPSFGNFECKPAERPLDDGSVESVPQYVVVGAVTTAASRALGETLGADALAEHCTDSWQMFHHRDEIGDSIEERTKEMTPDEVVKLVGKIPAQQHVHLEDAVDDAILRDRNMIAPVMASDGEEMLIANYDGAEFDPAPAMVHGQHTEELLLEAGYSLDDIDTMSREKMVFCATRRPRP